MSRLKRKLSDFKYSTNNFFYNIKLFFPLLVGYKWYGFDYGLDIFLIKWLQDGIKHFNNNEVCYSADHLKYAEQMAYALELAKMANEDYNFIEKEMNEWTSEDFKTEYKLHEKATKDLFLYLSKHYHGWWD